MLTTWVAYKRRSFVNCGAWLRRSDDVTGVEKSCVAKGINRKKQRKSILLWQINVRFLQTSNTHVTQITTSKRWQCCDSDSEEICFMHGFSFTESRSVLAETNLVDRPTFISDTSNKSLQQIHTWELYFHYYFYLPWITISNDTERYSPKYNIPWRSSTSRHVTTLI